MIVPIIIIVAIVLILFIFIYNNIIQRKNAVDNAYYSIDVQLKKRYDLIPQLVETVKGYMKYEKDLLEKITALRSQVLSDKISADQKVDLDNQISGTLQRLAVSVENYPDLKASSNFLSLQGSMNETEEQLAASRRFYNAAVTDYHNALETFPSNVIAGIAGMKKRNFFSISEAEKAVPTVNFQ